VGKLTNICEFKDCWHSLNHLIVRDPQELTDEKCVLARIQLGVKSGAELQERRDLAANLDTASRWLKNASQHLQHGALSGAVWPNYSDGFPRLNTEIYVAQRPEFATLGVAAIAQHRIPQLALLAQAQVVLDA
jgi:hypothetical protein